MSVGKEANISMKKPVLKNNSIFDQWHYTMHTVGYTQCNTLYIPLLQIVICTYMHTAILPSSIIINIAG